MPHKTIEARREYHRKYREANREKLSEMDHRSYLENRDERLAKNAAYRLANYPRLRQQQSEYQKNENVRAAHNASSCAWSKRNPEKKRAYAAVQRALKSGRLVRGPCETCGSADVHSHHEDYSKPLDVRWFCPAHHETKHHKQVFAAHCI